jgi:hypothetical protein
MERSSAIDWSGRWESLRREQALRGARNTPLKPTLLLSQGMFALKRENRGAGRRRERICGGFLFR